MFDNIGRKIKILATVVCLIGIIISVIGGIIIMTEESLLYGFLVAILGSLFCWIASFFAYGFGQLVENSDILVQQNKAFNKILLDRSKETKREKSDKGDDINLDIKFVESEPVVTLENEKTQKASN